MSLAFSKVTAQSRPPEVYGAALLHALAREEAAGRKPQRLTEPGMATWSRFKGRLGPADFLRLLCEDAAVLHPVPFGGRGLTPELDLERVTDAQAGAWLAELPSLELQASGADYIAAQARLLGVTTKGAKAELHQVKSHQRVLELPGTGGQLAHHLVTTQPNLVLQTNMVIACGTWQEQVLAGLVALDLGSPTVELIHRATALDMSDPSMPLRQQRFDFVVGLDSAKGGELTVADQLALWYPDARVVLV